MGLTDVLCVCGSNRKTIFLRSFLRCESRYWKFENVETLEFGSFNRLELGSFEVSMF